jgi:hypothetical protein
LRWARLPSDRTAVHSRSGEPGEGNAKYQRHAPSASPRDLTRQDQDEAERKVALVYDPLDLSVPRKQVAKARGVLDYIRAVRADPIGPALKRRRCSAASRCA